MKMFNAVKRHVVKAYNAVIDKAQALAITAATGLATLLGGANDAAAALPASVGTTVTAIQTDGQAIFDLIFPVVGIFLGLTIVIKLFKRFSNKV